MLKLTYRIVSFNLRGHLRISDCESEHVEWKK